MDVVRDTKDWTWVLDRPCAQCGADVSQIEASDIAPAIRALLPRWTGVLMSPGVRTRPDLQVWSALEYAAHVRDAFVVCAGRLARMLHEDDPVFADWDQDNAAIEGDYAALDPVCVADGLEMVGRQVASAYCALTPSQVQRVGRRSDGATFTVLTLGRYFVHDAVHHLHDVNG